MEQTWRWFGKRDPISLLKIRQAGATGVVSALHDVAPGEVWSRSAIAAHRNSIEQSGLRWSVVESLPVPEAIRLQQAGHEALLAAYIESLANLGEEGVKVICYNFMPVIDWTRTNLHWRLPNGASTLRFDATQWAAFDVFLLQRKNAAEDYSPLELENAERLLHMLDASERDALVKHIAAGLPGSNVAGYSLQQLREVLMRWSHVTKDTLRQALVEFLKAVAPVCERYGMCLCLHPDDPPRPLLGLPRIASSTEDFQWLFEQVPSPANGMTLCVGSLGASRTNDPAHTAKLLADRVYFTHLRSVQVEADGSFIEAEHLEGDVNLVAVIRILVSEERRRRALGHPQTDIPMRPDHGHLLEGDTELLPGYSWLGRLKALAELRGVLRAVEQLT